MGEKPHDFAGEKGERRVDPDREKAGRDDPERDGKQLHGNRQRKLCIYPVKRIEERDEDGCRGKDRPHESEGDGERDSHSMAGIGADSHPERYGYERQRDCQLPVQVGDRKGRVPHRRPDLPWENGHKCQWNGVRFRSD